MFDAARGGGSGAAPTTPCAQATLAERAIAAPNSSVAVQPYSLRSLPRSMPFSTTVKLIVNIIIIFFFLLLFLFFKYIF